MIIEKIFEYVDECMKRNPKANRDILTFIFTFGFSHAKNENDYEHVRSIFRDGYCYYFAKMLEVAFPGGDVVWTVPFGHMAYQYQGVVYDIEGIYDGEATEFIPESYMRECVMDFRHVPGTAVNSTEQDLANIILRYRECHKNEKRKRKVR